MEGGGYTQHLGKLAALSYLTTVLYNNFLQPSFSFQSGTVAGIFSCLVILVGHPSCLVMKKAA